MFIEVEIFVEMDTKKFVSLMLRIIVVEKNSFQFKNITVFGSWCPFRSLFLKRTGVSVLLICLPLVLNIINLVFEMLTAILLLRNQFAIFWSSSLTKLIRSGKFLFSARHEVSSANKNVARLVIENKLLI